MTSFDSLIEDINTERVFTIDESARRLLLSNCTSNRIVFKRSGTNVIIYTDRVSMKLQDIIHIANSNLKASFSPTRFLLKQISDPLAFPE